jgi:hypothetical protein
MKNASSEIVQKNRCRVAQALTSALAFSTGPTPAKLGVSKASFVASLERSCIPIA